MQNLLLLLLAFCLSACQTTKPTETSHQKPRVWDTSKSQAERYAQKNDSAPKGPPPQKFKNQIPKKEPLSRFGNPVNYKVDGKQYNVLQTSSGYRARGTASWYATKFHKQRTSSGEAYDMYALTAAHKTLPLPSYIRVKNLDNGRSVVVRVNDRGPFHSNRVIDLSYAAAVKLGIFPKGTANVEIEAVKGYTSSASFYLQAGAFTSNSAAQSLRDRLHRMTKSPVFVEHYQTSYVVKLGPFTNRNQTENLKKVLSRNGIYGSFMTLG